MRAIMLCLLVASCVPPETSYYVAYVAKDHGELVQELCAFDSVGTATFDCHEAYVDEIDDGPIRPGMPQSTMPPEAAPPPVAPPTTDDVARAVTRKDVARLVELCRTTYAADLQTFRFAISIAPSGDVTDVTLHDVAPRFADCAQQAIRTASFTPYDGAAVSYELELPRSAA